ncbi:cysteine desulfurase [Acetobacteraceae bacterium]|nr:cysteine desulfurase [Candidatus Parcubacteria bacterium]
MKFWPFGDKNNRRIFADAAAGYGNPGSLHREGAAAKEELEAARERIAASIGAHADEIIFTGSGTEANNLAIFGSLRKVLRSGESPAGAVHAITTAIEHPSVLEPLRALVHDGLVVTELAVDSEGKIDIKTLRESITQHTVLICVQMINSEIGTIQNIKEIAKEIRHAKKQFNSQIYFHTDASQAPLWMPLRVESLGVDMLTLDAQKVLGPKSIGALYIKRGTQIEPIILGGGQEKGLRSGTENPILASAFAGALSMAAENALQQTEKTGAVRNFLIEEIKKLIPNVVLNGAKGDDRVANNINISIPNLDGQMAVIAMDREGVAISTRSACSIEDEELSYVLLAIGSTPAQAKTALRITLLPDATTSDAKQIAQTLADVAKRYRAE